MNPVSIYYTVLTGTVIQTLYNLTVVLDCSLLTAINFQAHSRVHNVRLHWCFRVLLQQGASLCSVNCDGDVPLDIAEDEATETMLQEHTSTHGQTTQHLRRHIRIVYRLQKLKPLLRIITQYKFVGVQVQSTQYEKKHKCPHTDVIQQLARF